MPYSTIASGRLYPPLDGSHEIDRGAVETALDKIDGDAPIVSDESASVEVDEMYYHDGNLELQVPMGEWHVNLKVPLRPSESFANELGKLNRAFDALSKESGYFVNHGDVAFVETVTPDSQGRVTLGRDYAGESVRIIGTHD